MMLVSLMVASMIGMNGVVSASETTKTVQDTKTIEMWYLYSNEDGTFWLEYGKDMEDTIIHVSYDDLAKWKISKNKLDYGFKMNAVYSESK